MYLFIIYKYIYVLDFVWFCFYTKYSKNNSIISNPLILFAECMRGPQGSMTI